METKPSKLYRSALVLFLLALIVVQFGGKEVNAVQAEGETTTPNTTIYLPVVMKAPYVPPEPVIPTEPPNTSNWPGGLSDIEYKPNQHMLVYNPNSSSPMPLLVGLHTWQRDYRDRDGADLSKQAQPVFDAPYAQWAIANQWVFINPDFRGPNGPTPNPNGMGSDLAVQDIVDAVSYAENQYNIDTHRIYLVGASGGGHMALLMASRRPDLWAGISTWSGISDLPKWYVESQNLNKKYSVQISSNCEGIPNNSNPTALENCLHRSPISFLATASSSMPPIDINAGIQDGHILSQALIYAVPITHSINSFNLLVPEQSKLTDQQASIMIGPDYGTVGTIPSELKGSWPNSFYDNAYLDTYSNGGTHQDKHILFQRQCGNARLTIFNGNHEIIYWAALYWLSRQWKP